MPPTRVGLGTIVIVILVLTLTMAPEPLYAFHYPWDQGHDTFVPNEPDEPPDDCNKCFSTGSPFIVATGAYTTSAQDLFIPGRIPLYLERNYHGRELHNGMFGHGWTFTYGVKVIEVTDGVEPAVLLRRETGQKDRFVRNPDGTFTPPSDALDELIENGDGTFELRRKDGAVRSFDVSGNLVAVAEPGGAVQTLSYDAVGFLVSVTSPGGRFLNFTKGANGKVESITDPLGNQTGYQYDADGNLVAVTDRSGGVTQYSYDAQGNLLTITDPLGNLLTSVTYDDEGRVASYTEDGVEYTLQYRPVEQEVVEWDSLGNSRTLSYNDDIAVTATVDALGNQKSYSFDEKSRVHSITDKNGHTTTYAYDEKDRLTAMTDALGNVTAFTYESAFNGITSMTDPRGNTISVDYDAKGYPIQQTDPFGNQTQFGYDEQDRINSTTNALGNTVTFSRDVHGSVTGLTDALGHAVGLAYDSAGNLISVTDPVGGVTQYQYDGEARLISTTNALGNTTQFGYDAAGNFETLTDAGGNTTTFSYDSLNRVSQITNALAQAVTASYDVQGRLASSTNAAGQVTTFAYDALDRLLSKTTADNQIHYTYDSEGMLLSVTDDDSSLSFVYDAANRLIRVMTQDLGAQPATIVDYTYDAAGNRLTLIDPAGGVTAYVHDGLNRRTAITNPQGQTTNLAYDALSRLVMLQHDNGVETTIEYDATSRLTAVGHEKSGIPISNIAYNFDTAGNIVSTVLPDGGGNYHYDAVNQLISATYSTPGGVAESYTYDAAGNRSQSHLSSTYSYDADNRLLADDSYSYAYDPRGNLVQKQDLVTSAVTSFSYDAESQLVRIDFPDGGFATYSYDGLGRRIQKNVNGDVRRYVYDLEDVLFEYDGSNTAIARYTHGPGIDLPLAVERDGQSFFFHLDSLASVRWVTDAVGTVVRSFTYDSFGRVLAETGSLESTYTFAGREFDAESGLSYLRARYYDPWSGRFLQADPLGLRGELNLYVYASNNPLSWKDPLGLAKLYYWPPDLSAGMVGHVSLGLSDGKTHISFWPGDSNPWPLAPLASGEFEFHTLPRDINLEGGRQPQVLEISGVDEAKVKTWFENIQKPWNLPDFNLYGNNCSHIVRQALNAGGVDLNGHWWTTWGLFNEAQQRERRRRDPAPLFQNEFWMTGHW